MKTIVRATVLALVVTGIAASSQISSASTKTATLSKTSAMPTPMCAPDGSTTCGMNQ